MKKAVKSPLFVTAAAIAAFFVLVVLFAGVLMPHDPLKTNLQNTLAAPSAQYPLGTDDLGRCVLSRLIAGTRATLGTALLVQACTLFAGTALGMLAGWFGGAVDRAISTVIDILLAFPSLILALVVAGLLGPGLFNVALAMAAVGWVEPARVARSMVQGQKGQTYIMAARAAGSGHFGILRRHILPHTLPGMLVVGTLGMAGAIIGISSMSYLGLGARPPAAEWGSMLSEARLYMGTRPLALVAVIACVLLAVAAFQMMGEALRGGMDPRASQLGLGKPKIFKRRVAKHAESQ